MKLHQYGVDEYSRWVADDNGDRCAVEPYPPFEHLSWRQRLWPRIVARRYIVGWHIHRLLGRLDYSRQYPELP